jgi:hypothetical protein
MQRERFVSLFLYTIISSLLMFIGCSKPLSPTLKTPPPILGMPAPPIVKQYQHITLRSTSPSMQNTGIYLSKGELYSILARGSINIWPSGPRRSPRMWHKYHEIGPEDGGCFMVRIGEKNDFFYPFYGRNGSTFHSYEPGYLYLGIKDGKVNQYGKSLNRRNYKDNFGYFSVDIIVWKRDDYVQIADFFEKMKEKDPNNVAIIDAHNEANKRRKIYLAEAKATKEIEETKTKIQELKEESQREKEKITKTVEKKEPRPGTKPVAAELTKDKQIAQLQVKLSELMETLKQLEEMKKQLQEEKRKTGLLSKELSEKERREKDLLSQLERGKESPPVIVVASPKNDVEVEVGTIAFSGVAEDAQGLKGLDFFINDNPLLTKVSRDIKVVGTKPPKRLEFAERILLQRGENKIRIRATDTDGLVAEKILTVRYRETRKNVWAVVIGINKYRKNRHLKYAVNDARAFYEHLIRNNRIPKENVTLLINQDAHIFQLRSILGTHLKSKAGKEDMVIIYFAGHGACEKDVMSPDKDGLEKYLLPYDADPKNLYGSALPMNEVSRIFNRIRSERLIFIADACYSGASGGRTISLTGVRANISDAFLDRIARGRGRIILTASGPNEVSGEDEKLKHGVFTYFLLEGLRGKADTDRDGMITVAQGDRTRATPREKRNRGGSVGFRCS